MKSITQSQQRANNYWSGANWYRSQVNSQDVATNANDLGIQRDGALNIYTVNIAFNGQSTLTKYHPNGTLLLTVNLPRVQAFKVSADGSVMIGMTSPAVTGAIRLARLTAAFAVTWCYDYKPTTNTTITAVAIEELFTSEWYVLCSDSDGTISILRVETGGTLQWWFTYLANGTVNKNSLGVQYETDLTASMVYLAGTDNSTGVSRSSIMKVVGTVGSISFQKIYGNPTPYESMSIAFDSFQELYYVTRATFGGVNNNLLVRRLDRNGNNLNQSIFSASNATNNIMYIPQGLTDGVGNYYLAFNTTHSTLPGLYIYKVTNSIINAGVRLRPRNSSDSFVGVQHYLTTDSFYSGILVNNGNGMLTSRLPVPLVTPGTFGEIIASADTTTFIGGNINLAMTNSTFTTTNRATGAIRTTGTLTFPGAISTYTNSIYVE